MKILLAIPLFALLLLPSVYSFGGFSGIGGGFIFMPFQQYKGHQFSFSNTQILQTNCFSINITTLFPKTITIISFEHINNKQFRNSNIICAGLITTDEANYTKSILSKNIGFFDKRIYFSTNNNNWTEINSTTIAIIVPTTFFIVTEAKE